MYFKLTKHWIYEVHTYKCTGLEIGGLLATVAGTGLGVAGSAEARNNMNKAANNELTRQQDYAKQGQAAFQNSLNQSTPGAVKANMGKGTQRALQEYTKLQGNEVPGSASGTTQINSPQQLTNTEDAIVQGKVGQQNKANAVLQGYNENTLNQGLKDSRANTKLNQIGSFSSGSESVLPLELQQAQHSGDGLSGIGSLLSTIGGLTSLYGAVNAPVHGVAGAATGNQLNALGSGFGPASAGYANSLGASHMFTPQAYIGNLGYGSLLGTMPSFGY